MTIEECCKKIEDFESKIKDNNHRVYYIENRYSFTPHFDNWIEIGYLRKYEIIRDTCSEFRIGVILELDDKVYSLEELYSTKEEAKEALDNIEKIGE